MLPNHITGGIIMFSIKLKELYGSLTYSETRIINYILANKDNIDILTSENLAKEVGVSPSTITRFTQKFGYSSIRNLLLDFKNESDETSKVYEIQEIESTDDTCKKVKSIYINSIESSYFNLDLNAIDNAANYISKADKVLCFGTYNSQLMAKYFSNKLLEIGINSYCDDDLYVMASIIRDMKPTDVVFIVSHSGKSKDSLRIAQIAEKNNIPIVSLTGYKTSKLWNQSSIVIESAVFDVKTGLTSSAIKCSQLYLIDSLFLCILKKNYNMYNKKTWEMYEVLEPEIGQKFKTKALNKKSSDIKS